MATASVPTSSPNLQSFAPVQNAPRARPAQFAAKTRPVPTPSDQFGVRRLERAQVKTAQGYQRLANDILRDVTDGPLTRAEQDEIRTERKKLGSEEIDPNVYRRTVARKYVPYERRSRRRRGWVRCEFVLPKRLLEGLKELAKYKAGEQLVQRQQEPYGYRRRYPRTPSSFAAEAVNRLLTENGFSEYCVED